MSTTFLDRMSKKVWSSRTPPANVKVGETCRYISEIVPSEVTPVVFELQDQKPDVKIELFGVFILHVHSHILRKHSANWAKLLDTLDKSPAPESAEFKYEWQTVIDWTQKLEKHEFGNWYFASKVDLISRKVKLLKTAIGGAGYLGNDSLAMLALIRAMHNLPYSVEDPKGFGRTVALANHHRCLPILAKDLSNAFGYDGGEKKSEHFHAQMRFWAHQLIGYACKLRCKPLYADCVRMIAGGKIFDQARAENIKFDNQEHNMGRVYEIWRNEIKDPRIKNDILQMHLEISAKAATVHQKILNWQYLNSSIGLTPWETAYNAIQGNRISTHKAAVDRLEPLQKIGHDISRLTEGVHKSHAPIRTLPPLPEYFRMLHDNCDDSGPFKEVRDILKPLLVNKLELEWDDPMVGKGPYHDVFLCEDIVAYPWDDEEVIPGIAQRRDTEEFEMISHSDVE